MSDNPAARLTQFARERAVPTNNQEAVSIMSDLAQTPQPTDTSDVAAVKTIAVAVAVLKAANPDLDLSGLEAAVAAADPRASAPVPSWPPEVLAHGPDVPVNTTTNPTAADDAPANPAAPPGPYVDATIKDSSASASASSPAPTGAPAGSSSK